MDPKATSAEAMAEYRRVELAAVQAAWPRAVPPEDLRYAMGHYRTAFETLEEAVCCVCARRRSRKDVQTLDLAALFAKCPKAASQLSARRYYERHTRQAHEQGPHFDTFEGIDWVTVRSTVVSLPLGFRCASSSGLPPPEAAAA